MKLPMVMPSNRRKMCIHLDKKFPGRLGLLLSQSNRTIPKHIPFACDNDRFSVWMKGKQWSSLHWLKFLDWCTERTTPPLWVLVPDVVANPDNTVAWYHKWVSEVTSRNLKPAFAVQNGMTPEIIYDLRPVPEVVFVGGTTEWKWRHLKIWTENFPRVHVGRVNTRSLLWRCHRAGAESSDGTGWYHHHQYRQLVRYLEQTQNGQTSETNRDCFL